MKSSVFVRPNLKMFLVAAVLLAVIQHLIMSVHSQGRSPLATVPVNARELSLSGLEELAQRNAGIHDPDLYHRLSSLFEQKGDYKRALYYLRRAEKAAQAREHDL